MSETPRSDEDIGISEDFRGVWVVPVDIARQLETELEQSESELAEARAEIERKDKLIEQMRGALSILGRIWFYGDFKPETPNEKHLSVMMKEMGFKYESENEVLAALEAAERG